MMLFQVLQRDIPFKAYRETILQARSFKTKIITNNNRTLPCDHMRKLELLSPVNKRYNIDMIQFYYQIACCHHVKLFSSFAKICTLVDTMDTKININGSVEPRISINEIPSMYS